MKTSKLYLFVFFILVGFSCKKSTEIDDTAISLKDLREIGELTTAEYYGEVIESLQENYVVGEITHLQNAYKEIRETYSAIGRKYGWRSKRLRKFKKTNLQKTDEYKILQRATKNRISFAGDGKFLEEIVWKKDWETYYEDYKKELEKYIVKRNDKTELVYLGRGWVKAGFDLSKLDTSKIHVENDTLFVSDFDPMIFDVDINPWFIPNKSKGFELIRSRNESKISFDQVTLVKMTCKERLRQDAFERGIHHKARDAAEEIFTGFFASLQMEEFKGGKFHSIVIEYTPLFEDKLDILIDHKVDSTEAATFAFLIGRDVTVDDYEKSVMTEINNAVAGQQNAPAWKQLVDSILVKEE
ncbi:MAG: hypothetical protein ACI85I_000725 [Arenicella sp.]|jgi:hypothetical protein